MWCNERKKKMYSSKRRNKIKAVLVLKVAGTYTQQNDQSK